MDCNSTKSYDFPTKTDTKCTDLETIVGSQVSYTHMSALGVGPRPRWKPGLTNWWQEASIVQQHTCAWHHACLMIFIFGALASPTLSTSVWRSLRSRLLAASLSLACCPATDCPIHASHSTQHLILTAQEHGKRQQEGRKDTLKAFCVASCSFCGCSLLCRHQEPQIFEGQLLRCLSGKAKTRTSGTEYRYPSLQQSALAAVGRLSLRFVPFQRLQPTTVTCIAVIDAAGLAEFLLAVL